MHGALVRPRDRSPSGARRPPFLFLAELVVVRARGFLVGGGAHEAVRFVDEVTSCASGRRAAHRLHHLREVHPRSEPKVRADKRAPKQVEKAAPCLLRFFMRRGGRPENPRREAGAMPSLRGESALGFRLSLRGRRPAIERERASAGCREDANVKLSEVFHRCISSSLFSESYRIRPEPREKRPSPPCLLARIYRGMKCAPNRTSALEASSRGLPSVD